jgi:hypothetical protein
LKIAHHVHKNWEKCGIMTMFTNKEIENLRRLSSSRIRFLINSILVLTALASLGAGISNLMRSDHYAQIVNMSVCDVFFEWIHGFNVAESYSGPYCIALYRLLIALLQFGLIVFNLALILMYRIILKRNVKILELLDTKRN